jgi:riboflavin kinase/FMN adenylyltransferase
MEIFTHLTNLRNTFPNITMALGTFDGVHIGHQQIITTAVEMAKRQQGTSVVFTFSNHPLSVIDPGRCPLQLITPEDKRILLRNMGVDIMLNIPFTDEFLRLTAQEFIEALMENLQPKHIVVGPNYSFGYKSLGTPAFLEQSGKKYGFAVDVHAGVYFNDLIVSSTLIRQLILDGKVDEATNLLGRPVFFSGTVLHGDKRGREIGFPTVNLAIPFGLAVPADGVYAVSVQYDGRKYNGVANVGVRPTFDGKSRNMEIHILDFEQTVYGETVTVSFVRRIRGEMLFQSLSALKEQITADIAAAINILNL